MADIFFIKVVGGPFQVSISHKKIIYPSIMFANTILNDNYMTTITDEYMHEILLKIKEY